MLKTLMMTTTAVALVVGSAVAQSPTPDSPKAPPMQKSEPMPAPGATGSRQFVTQQSADQWLATKFKGTDVIGSNNEKIGDVNDCCSIRTAASWPMSSAWAASSASAQKDVALAPAAFQVQPATDREELKLKLADDPR